MFGPRQRPDQKITGKKAIFRYEKMQQGEVRHTCADITKAHKILGYRPKTNLEEGLKSFFAWKKQL